MSSHRYEVVVAPGCHREPYAPVVSRHRSLAAAVRRAMRSDRLRVEPATHSVCLFQAQSRQPTEYGYGLFGGRHEGTFRAALEEAERAEREWLAEQ